MPTADVGEMLGETISDRPRIESPEDSRDGVSSGSESLKLLIVIIVSIIVMLFC